METCEFMINNKITVSWYLLTTTTQQNYLHLSPQMHPIATTYIIANNRQTDGRTTTTNSCTNNNWQQKWLFMAKGSPPQKIVCYQGIKKSHTKTSWRLGASNYVDREYVTLGGFLIYMDSLLNHPISVIHSGIHSFDCLVHQLVSFVYLGKTYYPFHGISLPSAKWSLLERM